MEIQVINCPNCNGEIHIDASREFGFCNYCGTKLAFNSEKQRNATQIYADNKEAALEEMKKLVKHFKPTFEFIDELVDLNNFIQNYDRNEYNNNLLVGIVMGILTLALFGTGVSFAGEGGIAFIIVGLLAGIVSGLQIAKFVKRTRENEDFLIYAKQRKEELNEYIISTYNSYPNCPLGIEYCTRGNLKAIYEYIRKGRAETIKEAINLMFMDAHNSEMKNIAINTEMMTRQNLEANQINTVVNIANLLLK